MTSLVRDWDIYLVLLFDFVVLYSLVVTAFYAVYVLAATFWPAVGAARRSVPLVFFLSFAALWTPLKDIVTSYLSGAVGTLGYLFAAISNFEHFSYALLCVWLAGMLLHGGCVGVGVMRLRHMMSRLPDAPPDPTLAAAQAMAGFDRALTVKTAKNGFSLSSWTWGRDYLILPVGFAERHAEDDRLCMYLHELTHLRSRDPLKYLFLSLTKCVFWFNPAVRAAVDRCRCHIEIACDRAVLARSGREAPDYARLLLRSLQARRQSIPGFSGSFREVCWRMSVIFKDPALVPGRRKRAAFAIAFIFAVALFFAFFDGAIGPDPFSVQLPPYFFRWQGLFGMYTMRQ